VLETETFIVKEGNDIVERDFDVYQNCEIPDGTVINFLSKDEIVEDLYSRALNESEIANIKNSEDLNSIQETVGRFIRQKYGLWLSPHPYSNNSNIAAENFADTISLEILQRLQTRIKQ